MFFFNKSEWQAVLYHDKKIDGHLLVGTKCFGLLNMNPKNCIFAAAGTLSAKGEK